MRIQFSNNLLRNKFGPGVFIRRLMDGLDAMGADIVNSKPDIFLNSIVHEKKPVGSKAVFRVDGCYYEKNKIKNNATLRKGVKTADGVIYQSEFSKKMTSKILGVSGKVSCVIHNGFDQSIIPTISPNKKDCKFLVASCANWRPSKRPKSIVKGFLASNLPRLGGKLVLIGPGTSSSPYVFHTGVVNEHEVFRWLKSADAMIHLCYIDSCPNAVIEGLSFGLPVVCNNIGGTPEIVKSDGIVVNCDQYNFDIIDKVSDKIDPAIVASALNRIYRWDKTVCRDDLDISKSVRAYYKFMESLL